MTSAPRGLERSGLHGVAAPRDGKEFECIAAQGFGDSQNSYAFSMAWHEGDLFVGTVRNMLALVNASPPPLPTNLVCWPVPTPKDLYEMDQRAQIWRYHSRTRQWSCLYTAPVIKGEGGLPVPRDIGYRHMVVFRGRQDSSPALYVAAASSSSRGNGTHILRCGPGGVDVASEPVLGDRAISSLRELAVFRDRLYMSPTGRGRAWNAAESPRMYETEDPIAGKWRPVSEGHFGDPTNEAMYSMTVFRDHLYVGTLNPKRGYQIWKTRAEGAAPYRWTQVVRDGAHRGNLNEGVVSMCVFNDALFVGSGISNGGRNRTYGIGPAAGEIIKVYPDDSWDLIVGDARATPDGMKRPRSGMSAGFDNPFAGYMWSMAAHDGQLYVGTFDSLVFASWGNGSRWPRQFTPDELGDWIDLRGGFDLWRTSDGLEWKPVTRNGFGNPFNYGARTVRSTPRGLFVGTANPFAPKVARRSSTGWEYVNNPRGGAEIWFGATSNGDGRL